MYTIKDIAKKAGVSPSTASRALNNNPRISEETKKRIRKIASQMEYQPDYAGRNLTLGEANMVGIIFPVTGETAPANPFHIDLMRGISTELQKRNYEMLVAIAPSQKQLLSQVQSMVKQAKVHNFVIFYSQKKDPIIKYLAEKNLNFVIIGSSNKYKFVDNDNVAAGFSATEFLWENKQVKYPAFVESSYHWSYELDRRKGYQKFLTQKNVKTKIIDLNPDKDELNQFLKNNSQVDGLIFSDDILYLRYLQELKNDKKYPVICFNSSKLLGMVLGTTLQVDLQPKKLGNAAIEVLFSKLQHKIIPYEIG
ncbi:LacI family DNA-binding transcriptional regulator [Lactobacillus sp. LL6]|uniref:LacI family DNA-binding transcriptional regulator n=1 Tax=Lactobacillus sp. LL6 TaxID=2596827 RepID=UPI0011857A1D|nr:LacI family DNA-binding transcriptional regulator [Lactobacillus sp. LL6]TSO27018.1 LacI family DNA-binding transcriptional regulator [Lactobacillus sp. LL6]